MKCQNCEHENLKGATFCGLCGVDLKIDVAPPESAPEQSAEIAKKEDQSHVMPAFVYGPPTGFVEEFRAMDDVPSSYYASVLRRFFSTFFDNIILGILGVFFLFFTPYGQSVMAQRTSRGGTFDFRTTILLWILSLTVLLVYSTFFMGKFGGTPGQRILGMRTLSCSKGNVNDFGYVKAFFRAVVYQALNILPIINFIVNIVSVFIRLFSPRDAKRFTT